MRTLTQAGQAAILRNLPMALMIEMDLQSGPLNLWTAGANTTYNGVTYVGTRGVGSIEAVQESPAEIKPLRFTMPGVSSADVSLVLSEPVQGKAARMKVAIFDPDTNQIAEVRQRWAGSLDVMVLEDDGERATVQVTAEHAAIDLLRPVSILYSDDEQQRLYPGDLFFQYQIDGAERRIVWPAASYFHQG